MSYTGTYATNPVTGKLEKISDKIPRIKTSVYFRKTDGESVGLGRSFESKQEKRNFLKKKGYAEAG